MIDNNLNKEKNSVKLNAKKDRLALIALGLMFSGPIVLISSSELLGSSGNVAEYISFIISAFSFLPVLASLIINIILAVSWKKLNRLSRGLVIASLIIMNPLFLFAYAVICFITGAALAGLPTM